MSETIGFSTDKGFVPVKQGTIQLNPNFTAHTPVVQNYVKRQGNYVIGSLRFEWHNDPYHDKWYYNCSNYLIATIPDGFRPKSRLSRVPVGWIGKGQTGTGADMVEIYIDIECNGEIKMNAVNTSGSSSASCLTGFDFGYETNPL